jgi:putative restriction endonuclease
MALMAPQPPFGEILGVPVGAMVRDRAALRAAGLHRPLQAGIDYGSGTPASSVVLSGVYPDDDQGDVVIYTGQGGLEPGTSRAIADQPLSRGNVALFKNRNLGIPVRVIRKTDRGFRYDGLYSVERCYRQRFADGFIRWRYELRRAVAESVLIVRDASEPPERVAQTVLRIVRDSAIARQVKEMYEYTCQICDITLVTAGGPYAEAAHIRPLGWPHHGRDTLANLLCLCPNDHVLFDFGAITIAPLTLSVTGDRSREGRVLTVADRHAIDPMNLDYHNEAIFIPIEQAPRR